MAYDNETQSWISDAVKDFNSRKMVACDGQITVKAEPLSSGQSMQDILNDSLQPDIWSPGGSIWLDLLNQEWQKKHGTSSGVTNSSSATILAPFTQSPPGNIISTQATDAPSLVRSPLVIAMWKPMAEALGWPKKDISWADIGALSKNPQGWKAYGHREWGDFKFGHANPNSSNSGLEAVLAENYAAAHSSPGQTLNSDDINKETNQDFVRNIESSIIHYGDSADAFATEMFTKGPSYLSAAVMDENLVVQANAGKFGPLPYPVVAIYPKEGTFISDHPFVIPQASWVTTPQRNAALALRDFLLNSAQQQKALQYGYRSGNNSATSGSLFDANHGVNADEPEKPLHYPSLTVTNQTKGDTWPKDRQKADVMLILDRSGSMNDDTKTACGTKLACAQAGVKQFVGLLGDTDKLGFTIFSDQSSVVSPVDQLGPKRQSLLNSIDNVTASGNTLLFDTIAEQYQKMSPSSKDIKAIVVLTDGRNDLGQPTVNPLVQQVPLRGENAGSGIRIFTIAYGSDAKVDDLTEIANAAGGQEYEGTPENIVKVYQQILQANIV